MLFSTDNVVLDDGTETIPGKNPMKDKAGFLAVKRCLTALCPQGFTRLSIADLGCCEGGYSVELARLGFGHVLGIEARQSNIDRCLYLKERTALPTLSFVKDTAWNLRSYGGFDIILCSGLLYHLDRPRAFLDLLSLCTKRVSIINTHFSLPDRIGKHSVSEMDRNEGLPGRWFEEPQTPHDETAGRSAWENTRSFWIQKDYLTPAIRDAGFPLVLEQLDFVIDPNEHRCILIGVKP